MKAPTMGYRYTQKITRNSFCCVSCKVQVRLKIKNVRVKDTSFCFEDTGLRFYFQALMSVK